MIYEEIKHGRAPNIDRFLSVAYALRARGAETIILGCTELSLLKKLLPSEDGFTDSLEVLAAAAIGASGKPSVGFSPALSRFVLETISPANETQDT